MIKIFIARKKENYDENGNKKQNETIMILICTYSVKFVAFFGFWLTFVYHPG